MVKDALKLGTENLEQLQYKANRVLRARSILLTIEEPTVREV